ncbi:MAG: electron transfer flavoprotein subunit alpha/FixB family protein, partial [Acidobacteria bacterium]|nr:electron transfer flavoprotein subunit alpha/FixB family protein [Acidobacteriota bacterium]
MANTILVFIEHVDGTVSKASWEAVRAAQVISAHTGHDTAAVILGSGIGVAAQEIAGKKLGKVYTVESDLLKTYTADGYAFALKQVTAQVQPAYVMLTHTYEVRDFAPKLAAAHKTALLGDNVNWKIEDGTLVLTRQAFQGKMALDVSALGDGPHFVSFQLGTFRGDECEAGAATVEALAVNLDADVVRQQPEERFKEAKAAVDLTAAPLIVSVGRGIKEQKNIEIVQKLAAAMGAEIAASRPICDNDWLPMDRQVGSSGQTVAPKMY